MTTPEVSTPPACNWVTNVWPSASSPTTPARMARPPSATTWRAGLAAPPGSVMRRVCSTTGTGASRLKRSVRPSRYSSRRRSPRTSTRTPARRVTSLGSSVRRRVGHCGTYSLTLLYASAGRRSVSTAQINCGIASWRRQRQGCVTRRKSHSSDRRWIQAGARAAHAGEVIESAADAHHHRHTQLVAVAGDPQVLRRRAIGHKQHIRAGPADTGDELGRIGRRRRAGIGTGDLQAGITCRSGGMPSLRRRPGRRQAGRAASHWQQRVRRSSGRASEPVTRSGRRRPRRRAAQSSPTPSAMHRSERSRAARKIRVAARQHNELRVCGGDLVRRAVGDDSRRCSRAGWDRSARRRAPPECGHNPHRAPHDGRAEATC